MIIKEIESKYRKSLGQQALEKLKIYIPMERGLFSQHNKEVNELIEIISKGLNADQHSQPTLEEVKKEWEALGYIWVEQRKKAQLEIHLLNTVSEITIYTSAKMYECIDRETDIVVQPLTYQEHNLLTKTFRALGWEV